MVLKHTQKSPLYLHLDEAWTHCRRPQQKQHSLLREKGECLFSDGAGHLQFVDIPILQFMSDRYPKGFLQLAQPVDVLNLAVSPSQNSPLPKLLSIFTTGLCYPWGSPSPPHLFRRGSSCHGSGGKLLKLEPQLIQWMKVLNGPFRYYPLCFFSFKSII